MIVIVCGGRGFRDRAKLFSALDFWNLRLGITTVVQGGQVTVDQADRSKKHGADYLAKQWAAERGIPCIEDAVTDADWKKIGPGAGPMRNGRMLKRKPQRVIAFEGGKGTADMLRQARAAGVKCIEVA